MLSKEEISMVLNTYMYMDYKEADDGMTLNEILKELSDSADCQADGIHYGEYTVLTKAAEKAEIGELVIGNQSHLLNFDTGTSACTFTSKDKESVYVVYRGTGDGEWPDNGIGMTAASTTQQERALSYFETVAERERFSEEQMLIVTGHSKGGNKAQYVTMSTKYDSLIDACYSIDGQGFSEKAVEHWKNAYGESGFQSRTDKITGIFGENDYVNVLGHSILSKDQVYYVKTPVKVSNFAGYHDIKYMFASLETDSLTGKQVTVFHGSKNSYVPSKGALGSYAASLSAALMQLEPEKRDGCALSLMQLMELAGDRKTGINGEKLTLSDIKDFFGTGVPLIAESIFFTAQGQAMLSKAFSAKTFSQDMQGRLTLMADCHALGRQAQILMQMAEEVKKYQMELKEIQKNYSYYLKSIWGCSHKLEKEEKNLGKRLQELNRLSEALMEISRLYMKTDTVLADELLEL